MVKAKNIRKIKEDLERYKKLLEKETDFIKSLKYKRLIRECEFNLQDVEIQLYNFDIYIHNDEGLHKEIFIDRYTYNVPVRWIADKYSVSISSVYRILDKAREVFEKRYEL
ncbi:hypothetical protein [Clostridium paraputrificum]|uniref:hypothetical protein n=1 Tax=Clostridium paraputrificum TaxID=29363 RepID=UPI0034A4795F